MSSRIAFGIGAMVIVALVGGMVFVDMQRRGVQAQLQEFMEASKNTEEMKEDETQAADILARVRRHITISDDVQPTVAEIVDVEALRAKNPFYEQAQEGDYLIITTNRAILYSPTLDSILDVMPIALERNTPNPNADE